MLLHCLKFQSELKRDQSNNTYLLDIEDIVTKKEAVLRMRMHMTLQTGLLSTIYCRRAAK
jgi:hypothetical protein